MKASDGRRGYVMMIDAIISIIVISFVIYVFFMSSSSEIASKQNSREFKEIHYLSEDVIDVLNKQGVLDEVGNEWAAANGSQGSPNWSNARAISTGYLNKTIPRKFGYRLVIDETNVIYDSDLDPASGRPHEEGSSTKTHSSRMLVGYGAGLPTRGHVARAFLTEIAEKTTSSYAYFGGFEGQGNLTKILELPDETDNVTSICLEYNAGDAFNLFINGLNAGSFPGNAVGDLGAKYQCVTAAPLEDYTLPGSDIYTFNLNFQGSDRRYHYVAGGYIRMTYNTSEPDTSKETGVSRYEFPGIEGIINLYSSFYVPGTLDSMSLHARFRSDYNASVNIGNVSVLDTSDLTSRKFCSVAGNEYTCDVPDANMSSILAAGGLSYVSHLSEATMPLNMIEKNISAISSGLADVILVTDLSNSMTLRVGYSDEVTNGVVRGCSDPDLYDNDTSRVSLAKCLDKAFINTILNVSGNRVGLVGYNDSAYDARALSSDNNSLIGFVDGYTDSTKGGTCTCCAINKAIDLLGATQETVSVDLSPYVESPHPYAIDLNPPASGTWVINGHPSALSMRLHFTSIITSENKTAGSKNYADYLWVTDADGHKVNLPPWGGNERANEIDVDANDEITDYWSGWGNGSFMTVNIDSDGYQANGNKKENGFIIDKYEYTKAGTATDRIRYIVLMSDGVPSYDCGKCGAYPGCGACTGSSGSFTCAGGLANCVGALCGPAISDADCTAEKAQKNYDAAVYTIGLGPVESCSNAKSTLEEMASVGEGEYMGSNNGTVLRGIYEYMAETIVNATDRSQRLSVAGHSTKSILYPDSYLEYAYTPVTDYSKYGSITLTYSTGAFNDEVNCEGSIYAPSNGVISDAKATSYSGEHWTDYLALNDSPVYTLRDMHFGEDYLVVGDPYIVQIPASYIKTGNNSIDLSTGDSPYPPYTGCSANNSAIYTLRISPNAPYGDVFAEKSGCNWTIQYEDGSNVTEAIPSDYAGAKNCSYTEDNVTYGTNDAVDDAIYRLLLNLDANNNNKTDIKFESGMVEFDYSRAGGVESLWGPITIKLVIWI